MRLAALEKRLCCSIISSISEIAGNRSLPVDAISSSVQSPMVF
jgi:hypothetical protein